MLTDELKYALLIGIGNYNQELTGFGPLKYSLADVMQTAEVLRAQGYVVEMINESEATKANIETALQSLSQIMDGKGTLIFYFSGHGARVDGENYLATYGSTAGHLGTEGLSVSALQRKLGDAGASRRVAFIDACRTQAGGKGIVPAPPFSEFSAALGIRVLYSAGPGQVSIERDDLQHSVFTHFLIRGLRGDAADNEGLITFDGLFRFVSKEMKADNARTRRVGVQIPFQISESNPVDMLLGKKLTSQVQAVLDDATSEAEPSGLTTNALLATQSGAADPPRRVARIRLADGRASLRPAGTSVWVPAMINRPLTVGDQCWVDENGHLEIQTTNGVFRLGSRADISFLNLSANKTQIDLVQGPIFIKLRRSSPGESIEISTPNAAISIEREGTYRIQVNPDANTTTVAVQGGTLEAFNGSQHFSYATGDSVSFTRGQAPTALSGSGRDSLDSWYEQREREDRGEGGSRRYVTGLIGAEDLDSNGEWRPAPSYGMAWFPNAPANWEPYRDGRWVWIDPWGWNWVDESAWGFAPFHYGRWVKTAGKWGWVPAGAGARTPYAPALVAWADLAHPAGSTSDEDDLVGWVPLAPAEAYLPPYEASSSYLNAINLGVSALASLINSGSATVAKSYANQESLKAMRRQMISRGGRAPESLISVPSGPADRALFRRDSAVSPSLGGVLAAENGNDVSKPPGAMSRMVIAQTMPAVAPIPFEQRASLWASRPGWPLTASQLRPRSGSPGRAPGQSGQPGSPARSLAQSRAGGTATAQKKTTPTRVTSAPAAASAGRAPTAPRQVRSAAPATLRRTPTTGALGGSKTTLKKLPSAISTK